MAGAKIGATTGPLLVMLAGMNNINTNGLDAGSLNMGSLNMTSIVVSTIAYFVAAYFIKRHLVEIVVFPGHDPRHGDIHRRRRDFLRGGLSGRSGRNLTRKQCQNDRCGYRARRASPAPT